MHGSNLVWNGYLQADSRIRLAESNDYSWNEYRLDLKAELTPLEKTHFYSEFWIRSLGFPTVQSSADLRDKDNVHPLNLDLREAYVDLYGIPFRSLDVRIGRQRIAWGTGDKINPTDNLNPDDLEDIWDYGRHLGSDALRASLYLPGYTLTTLFIPLFTPAVLPRGEWAAVLAPPFEIPQGFSIRNAVDTIVLPENNLKENATGGVKVKTNLFGYDVSLSYIYGRDDLPLAQRVVIMPTPNMGEADIVTELIYPRTHIAGMDMAGQFADIGVWAEAALFVPEEVILTTDLTAFGMGTQESVALANEPYVKLLIGADYTFTNGLYVNLQYLHGFIHERGADVLEDYFFIGTEWELLQGKIKIMPIAGSVEIKDFGDINENYAYVFAPEISYRPVDNLELMVGTRLIEGKDNTTFGRVRDNDEAYFRVKYSF
jgi:hypothetical protein